MSPIFPRRRVSAAPIATASARLAPVSSRGAARRVGHWLAPVLLALLAACAGKDELPEIAADSGEQQIYAQAERYLDNRNFDLAIRALQALESRYPFGKYAEQAQLELIYAHFSAFQPEAAIESADRFIRLHPQHPNVDYAYYLKGLSAASMNADLLARFAPTDQTKRDLSNAREAFAEFAQLLSRFPDSPYAPDAKARMVHLRNQLARHEIHVANYYLRRGAWLAAANRGRYVVENFQRTPAVADGLAVMAQGYILLGMDDLARDALDTLALNFPQHPALDGNGNLRSDYTLDGEQRSLVNRATFGLFDPPKPPQFDSRGIIGQR